MMPPTSPVLWLVGHLWSEMRFGHLVACCLFGGVPSINHQGGLGKGQGQGGWSVGPWSFDPLVIWRLVSKLGTKNEAIGNVRGPAEKGG